MEFLRTLKQKFPAQFAQGDWPSALSTLQKTLVDAVSQNDKEKEAWVHLVAGICYQKWGRITEATSLFDSAEKLCPSEKLRAELLLYRSKTSSQSGDFHGAKKYLEEIYLRKDLKNLLGSEFWNTVLWRLGLAYLMTKDITKAERLFEEHRQNMEIGGFPEANNILFNKVVTILCYQPIEMLLNSNILENIRYAADIYAHSEADTDRLAYRGKNIVHTLILEALYHWKLGNKFTSFQQVLVGGEFLKRRYLTPRAEGVGEVVAIVKGEAPVLVEILNNSVDMLLPHFVSWIEDFQPATDSKILLRAFRDAASIACEAMSGSLFNIYQYWPEVKPLEEMNPIDRNYSSVIEGAMEEAINASKKCVSEDHRLHPKVGMAIVKNERILICAYRGEIKPGDHAEYTGLQKCPKINLHDATLVTTLEPCTSRKHNNKPCALHIADAGVQKVLIGTLDPNPEIRGKGVLYLLRYGIEVEFFPSKYQNLAIEANKEFWEDQMKKYKIDIMEFEDELKKREEEVRKESIERSTRQRE